ncbi:hypothetical protein JG688_00002656 [Phytophthora aleatoria]|uniref:Uncharacterized protein n=1 Tax=Phytophthora aleatoria TaxID=2496075 RepID=A0A8J5J5F8_9STRA|nr:hypothetical protein JG688_00002656 [Phytophthora aleatoria]
MSRLHAMDRMSVDELLNPPDENTTSEEPTDEDFCGVGDLELAVDGSETRSENPGEDDTEHDTDEDLEPESIKEHLMWIGKLLVCAGATDVVLAIIVCTKDCNTATFFARSSLKLVDS